MGALDAPPKQGRTVVFALIAVVVVLGAAFGFYYVQSSGTIGSRDQTISSQSAQLSSDAAQITTDEGMVTNLTSTVASLRQTVAADNSQIASLNARIASLTAGYTKANGTITSLDSQISALNSQVSSLNVQVSTLNSQITSDTSQITALQAQVSSLQAIAQLSSNQALVKSQLFVTNSSGLSKLDAFTAQYAGYVLIVSTASSDANHTGCFVDMSFGANVISPEFGGITIPGGGGFFIFFTNPSALVFPVTPGTVTVYLATADATPQNATLSITYVY